MGPDNASLASRTAPPVAARTAGSQYDLDMISVSKSYGGPDVVSDVTFTLRHGEFLTLLGPSGSGKTTTLLMVAGFEHPTAGDIRVGGRSIVDEPPQRRNFGIVFQSYALFPHMSVLDNVEFPLRMRGVAKPVRRARAAEMLDRVGLRGFGARRPRQLSGGQQQRVALVRALVFEPTALLLDEPLGALDKRLRENLQLEIKAIQRRMGISVLYVTHDQEEAMVMSDRIAVMREGRIVQIGSPVEVYSHPRTTFVANFLGETNLFRCTPLASDGSFARVQLSDGTLSIARVASAADINRGTDFKVSVRPEDLAILNEGESRETVVMGRLVDRTCLGPTMRYAVDALGQVIVVNRQGSGLWPALNQGDPVRVGWRRDDAQLLSEE